MTDQFEEADMQAEILCDFPLSNAPPCPLCIDSEGKRVDYAGRRLLVECRTITYEHQHTLVPP